MEFLIRAINLLPAPQKKRIRLTVVGDGPAGDRLRRLVRRQGLESQVTFTGQVEDPSSWIAQADLFTLLSSNEGISNAMLEAMSCGVPVYVTPVGGHREVITDQQNGYLCHSRRPSRIARDLLMIMDDPERLSLAGKGQQKVEETFSLSRMRQELEDYLEGLVRRKTPHMQSGFAPDLSEQ
jgi:glycosyltransferase involved in cell wall biosynthesis